MERLGRLQVHVVCTSVAHELLHGDARQRGLESELLLCVQVLGRIRLLCIVEGEDVCDFFFRDVLDLDTVGRVVGEERRLRVRVQVVGHAVVSSDHAVWLPVLVALALDLGCRHA